MVLSIKKFLHNIASEIDKLLICRDREKQLVKFVIDAKLPTDARILDVGCGYGKNMRLLKRYTPYINLEGVDINPDMVAKNREQGLDCFTVEKFRSMEDDNMMLCDGMLFSHVIEHFQPEALKEFIEYYLGFLKPGGVVIISTPLMWKGFYWDFDHIKPYHPVGLNMVFGNNDAQVQYYSNVNLKLKDIWFGRIPYITHYHRGLYVKSLTSWWWRIVNWCYAILFKISFGIIGFYQNWMAVYIKEK